MKHNVFNIVKASLIVSLVVGASSFGTCEATSSDSGKIFHANAQNPGSAIDLPSVLSKSSTTLLFIHSPHCGPCKRMEPKLKKLAGTKSDLKIVDMILDSKNDPNGIGWESAAAKQFDVHAVPAYMIFEPNGKVEFKGEKAEAKVDAWLVEAGIDKKPVK